MYKKIVLDNGLTIILADMPTMESISIGVWIAAGGRYENKKLSGISHFLEHMVFKGTKKRSTRELKESIEGRGGLLNGFTGEEFTCYLAKVLSKDAAIAMDILSDMTLNPSLEPKEFLKERYVILEEVKMYMDMPNHHVHELLAELLWPHQPLGMPLTGTVDTIASMKREDLAAYQKEFYGPANIVVAVAGKLPPGEFIRDIEKKFKGAESRQRQVFEPVTLGQTRPRTNIFHKKTEQTHLAMGLHGYSRFSRDKYKVDLMNIILGGNMSSRLFDEVREKLGLAYEISSSVKHYHDTGALVISAGIDNKKIDKAVKIIVRELKKMKTGDVKKEEFRRAKEFYKGQLSMLFEDTMNHMLWLGEKFISGDYEFRPKDILKEIEKVAREDISEVAKDILTRENINLAVIGPTTKAAAADICGRLNDL
ncbi:MAG: pitrilysin family protein [Candidatus Omnitrophica bacterium]|nr:pitrilysin family protein [Candidatus Omnitrophota bacterium]